MLPAESIYMPAMSIKVIDHRNFGRKPIIGVHTIANLAKYLVKKQELLLPSSDNNYNSIIIKFFLEQKVI